MNQNVRILSKIEEHEGYTEPAKIADDEILLNEIKKCRDDIKYFINMYCCLKDQYQGRPVPFYMWGVQKEQIDIWYTNDYCITLKSRQIGISWLSAAFALHGVLFKTFYRAVVISKKEEDAISYLNKFKFMYEHLPPVFKTLFPMERETRLTVEFKYFKDINTGGSSIYAESSNPNAARSDTLNLVIFDEAAFIPDAHTIWTGAEPTIEKSHGKVLFISTANGYGNLFQEVWAGAADMQNGFKRNFISWFGDPTRTQEWYETKKLQYTANNKSNEFRQEYPASAEEAFLVTGITFFDADLIQSLFDRPQKKYIRGNLQIIRMPNNEEKITLIESSMGNVKVWVMPDKEIHYAIGADAAEGIAGGDNSIAMVYDRTTGEQVAEYCKHTDTDTFAKDLFNLGRYYNMAMVNVEMNACGESVMNYISKQRHYPSLYRQWRYDDKTHRRMSKYGFKTSEVSKRTALDAMAQLIRDNDMLPNSRELFSEMKTFVGEQSSFGHWKFGASARNKDDRIMATAMVAIILQEHPLKKAVKRGAAFYRPEGRFKKMYRSEGYDKKKVIV